MMMLDSGMIWSRVSSRSTGNLANGHSFASAARSASSPRLTICGWNGMSLS